MATTSPRILVVCYSRTGITRRVGEAIARAVGCDYEELRERRSRAGLLGWLRSGYEATYRRASAPLPLEHDLRQYDIVFVGSPTWNQALSSPVRGFLEQTRGQLPSVALFATCAQRGADHVLQQMAELLREPPLARLALQEKDVLHGPAVWVGELVEDVLSSWSRTSSVPERVAVSATASSAVRT